MMCSFRNLIGLLRGIVRIKEKIRAANLSTEMGGRRILFQNKQLKNTHTNSKHKKEKNFSYCKKKYIIKDNFSLIFFNI
jgi:hypothetical protein